MRIIKAGILDDVNIINNTKPGAELFVRPKSLHRHPPAPAVFKNMLTNSRRLPSALPGSNL